MPTLIQDPMVLPSELLLGAARRPLEILPHHEALAFMTAQLTPTGRDVSYPFLFRW
jgi:hypothetical protein